MFTLWLLYINMKSACTWQKFSSLFLLSIMQSLDPNQAIFPQQPMQQEQVMLIAPNWDIQLDLILLCHFEIYNFMKNITQHISSTIAP